MPHLNTRAPSATTRLSTLLAATSAGLILGAPAIAQEGQTLRIGIGAEATSIDPHYHNLNPNNQIARHIFDNLVKQDERQQLEPGLATEWSTVDETTWEFKLREDVTFHDGSKFNVEDVICTYERAPDVPNSPSGFGTYLRGKSFEAVDEYTLRVTTEGPYPLMANDLSTVPIVSNEHGCDASTEAYNSGEAAVGTGPYKYGEYTPGDSIVLEKYEDYWAETPTWDRVVFTPITSNPSRVAALLAGDVDVINQVPTVDIERLKENDEVKLSSGVSNRVIYLHLDHYREDSPFVEAKDGGDIENPLMNQKVREAISMAINREAIMERVMEGQSIPAGQLLPEGFFGRSDELEPVEYDPEQARQLLEEAGYPDGFQLTIHGPNDRYINDARIAEAVAQMLTSIGIETEVETMPRSVYFSRASSGGEGGEPEFSFILVGWGAGSGEASSPLRSLIHTKNAEAGFGASNRGRYSNEEVDRLIEEALRTNDNEEREQLLAEATEIAINDVAIIPIHYQVNTWAVREGLELEPRTDEYTLAMSIEPATN